MIVPGMVQIRLVEESLDFENHLNTEKLCLVLRYFLQSHYRFIVYVSLQL